MLPCVLLSLFKHPVAEQTEIFSRRPLEHRLQVKARLKVDRSNNKKMMMMMMTGPAAVINRSLSEESQQCLGRGLLFDFSLCHPVRDICQLFCPLDKYSRDKTRRFPSKSSASFRVHLVICYLRVDADCHLLVLPKFDELRPGLPREGAIVGRFMGCAAQLH